MDDAFWKVRPLFDQINKMAKKRVSQPEFVSIDEAMVRYFGSRFLKQCIRETGFSPLPWGSCWPASPTLVSKPRYQTRAPMMFLACRSSST